MILFKIHGGLGNQLFQWAYSFKLAENYKVYYDISFYKQQDEINNFDNRDFHLTSIIKPKLNLLTGSIYKKFISKPFYTILDNFSYQDVELNPEDHYLFDGFWQHEDYFKSIKDKTIDSLRLPRPKFIDDQDSCCIHVRRGDYLRNQDYYPVQDVSYYFKALDYINPSGNVYIISDDTSWCEKHFEKSYFTIYNSGTDLNDFSFMSNCSHQIISNSTYSWWAAWINKNPGKKVTYPSNWSGPASPPIDQICPKEWIKI